MAGLAIALDLLKIADISSKSLHTFSALSAVSAAASASIAVSFLPSYPSIPSQFDSREFFIGQIAVCEDADDSDEIWNSRWLPQWTKVEEVKTYHVDLKPLNSAFRPKALGATTVRACLVNFLPLLEAYIQPDEDEFEEDVERPAKAPVDPVVPLKSSATHVLREVAVVTTRRALERVVVNYVSPRLAWKLLKDVPKSAVRKAGRDISSWELLTRVCRTTFRGHALGVFANWIVQLVLDVYRYIRSCSATQKMGRSSKIDKQDKAPDLKRLLRKTLGNTMKGGASLVLASLGAGLGTLIIKPSTGTWIGCAVGDLAGPYLIGIWLDVWIFYGTFSPSDRDF